MSEKRPFVIRDAETGAVVCEFDPPDALWLDIQAFAIAAGITIEELIRRSLAEFLEDA